MNPRRLRLGLLTTATALAGVVLVIFLLQALHRPVLRKRIDLTAEQTVGLSDRAAEALRTLPEGSRLTAFLFQQEHMMLQVFGSSALPRSFARVRSLLEDAHIRGDGRVTVEILDESSPPIRIQEARERTERQIGEVLIVETPEQKQKLRIEDLFVYSQPTAEGEPARLLQDRLDSVLGDVALRLGRADVPRVGIVSGVAGVPFRDPRGLGTFVQEVLVAQGYQAVEVQDLAAAPEDLDLLAFIGQQREFLPAEREQVAQWIQEGRPLFLALGAGAPAEVVAQWNALLASTGIGFEEFEDVRLAVLCEPFSGQVGINRCTQLTLHPDRMSAQHPITRPLVATGQRQPAYADMARPLRISAGNDYVREEVVGTSTEAWTEVNEDLRPTDPAREPQRRHAVGLVAERWDAPEPARSGRTFVFGSAIAWYDQPARINRNLGASAVRWLLSEDEVGVEFVPVEQRIFHPDPETTAKLGRLFQFVIPGLPLLVSLILFWRRRR